MKKQFRKGQKKFPVTFGNREYIFFYYNEPLIRLFLRVAFLKLVNTSCSVHQYIFTGVERMRSV